MTTRRSLATLAVVLLILVAAVVALYAVRSQVPPTAVSPTSSPTPTGTTRPGSDASACGKLVAYAPGSAEQVLTLEWVGVNQTLFSANYHLVGAGTVPSDLGAQFAARTPQTLSVRGWFAPASPSAPREASVTDYVVTRLTEPCPVTR